MAVAGVFFLAAHFTLLFTAYWLLAILVGGGFCPSILFLSGALGGDGDIRFGALMGAMLGWPGCSWRFWSPIHRRRGGRGITSGWQKHLARRSHGDISRSWNFYRNVMGKADNSGTGRYEIPSLSLRGACDEAIPSPVETRSPRSLHSLAMTQRCGFTLVELMFYRDCGLDVHGGDCEFFAAARGRTSCVLPRRRW